MTKWQLLIALTLLSSCLGENKSDVQKVTAMPATLNSDLMDADTIPIKIGQSKINWVVTEMRGTSKRTGNIQFQSGYFLLNKSGLVGGKFTVDMQTIEVKDIPIHESIAKENLIDHLKSDAFFGITSFPTHHLKSQI
jgi:polyisoprenoid-binding protein YceI